jgi:hypothetical protein
MSSPASPIDLSAAEWLKSSRSGNESNCVEVAPVDVPKTVR